MRAMDANSEWFGVPASELMENAGKQVAAVANSIGSSFLILCGPGNNGGDGFASARYLKSKPKIFFVAPPKTQEAYENFLKAKNYRPILISKDNLGLLENAMKGSDIIIDALFGTGIRGKLGEPLRSVIDMANKSGKRIVSVDVPSGMDPESGKASDIAIKPEITISLHAPKPGVVGNKRAGRVILADIGIPPEALTHIGKGDFKFGYPMRKAKARKGDAGKVLVIGGSERYTGAPYFAAMAALRAGCDLSYVSAPKEIAARIAAMAPDLIVLPLESPTSLSKADVPKILSMDFDVLCIGNGLGDAKESLDAAAEIISKCRKPMVIDGDALKIKPLLQKLGQNVIMTPHAGEFKRLFGMAANEKNLKKLAAKLKCTILLKGSIDIIAQGTKVKYNNSGNPHMSKGGTGDILAGLCAGFLAQGIEPFQAACFATLVNGVAGDLSYTKTSVGLTASDILEHIGLAENILLN
jgi:ADP-dependent NAD(P)H-hydrate dehydratase / NAD(P)H-hydrate epimerase